LTSLEVGRVVKPHGLRGELKVRLHWPDSDGLRGARQVELVRGAERERHEVESARGSPGGALLKLAGVDTRDAAEEYRGASVWVARESLPRLEPGEYYLADLIGFEVAAPDGVIGTVTSVRTHPTVDSLVIEDGAGRHLEQPLSDVWLEGVDVEARRVRLVSRDGLID
jgi:16S rRNA processing protein RimM